VGITTQEPPLPGCSLVRSVAGPVWLHPSNGYVLPHEHVISDLRVWWDGAGDGRSMPGDDPPVGSALLDEMRRHPHGLSRENMVLADWVVAAKELGRAAVSDCQLVVDLTSTGLDPMPALARRAAEAAGIALVVSAGHYIDQSVPQAIRDSTVEALRDRLLHQVENGIDGCMVGVLGEIGTSAEITDYERRSLRAAAGAQCQAGLPMNVHLHPYARRGHEVLNVLEDASADLSRVALSHCDGEVDANWLGGLLKRGVFVEFDLFGTGPEWVIAGRGFSTDAERVEAVTELCDSGFSSQLLLSHDICTRNALHRFGGWGYDHLARRVFPLLDASIGGEARRQITCENALRFLSVSPA